MVRVGGQMVEIAYILLHPPFLPSSLNTHLFSLFMGPNLSHDYYCFVFTLPPTLKSASENLFNFSKSTFVDALCFDILTALGAGLGLRCL